MPKYFFHTRHNGLPEDEEGLELPDDRAAWAEAVTASGELIQSLGKNFKAGSDWQMEVCRANGETLFVLQFSAKILG